MENLSRRDFLKLSGLFISSLFVGAAARALIDPQSSIRDNLRQKDFLHPEEVGLLYPHFKITFYNCAYVPTVNHGVLISALSLMPSFPEGEGLSIQVSDFRANPKVPWYEDSLARELPESISFGLSVHKLKYQLIPPNGSRATINPLPITREVWPGILKPKNETMEGLAEKMTTWTLINQLGASIRIITHSNQTPKETRDAADLYVATHGPLFDFPEIVVGPML